MINPKAAPLIEALLRLYENPADAIADVSEMFGAGIAAPKTRAADTHADMLIDAVSAQHGWIGVGAIVATVQERDPTADAASLRAKLHVLKKSGKIIAKPAPPGEKGFVYTLKRRARRADP